MENSLQAKWLFKPEGSAFAYLVKTMKNFKKISSHKGTALTVEDNCQSLYVKDV